MQRPLEGLNLIWLTSHHTNTESKVLIIVAEFWAELDCCIWDSSINREEFSIHRECFLISDGPIVTHGHFIISTSLGINNCSTLSLFFYGGNETISVLSTVGDAPIEFNIETLLEEVEVWYSSLLMDSVGLGVKWRIVFSVLHLTFSGVCDKGEWAGGNQVGSAAVSGYCCWISQWSQLQTWTGLCAIIRHIHSTTGKGK